MGVKFGISFQGKKSMRAHMNRGLRGIPGSKRQELTGG
jgi:hypothetical protein